MNPVEASLDIYKQAYFGAWMTQAISVAAALGIADVLAAGPRTIQELAAQTHSHAPSLYRVMRALASVGFFSEDDQGRFTITPPAELLRSNVPASQRAFATMMGAEFHDAWGRLLHSTMTGQPGFDDFAGMPWFDYMTSHPDRHAIYDEAMTGIHGSETQPVLDAYDFSTFHTVVDIGGGNGSNLSAILQRHPRLQGILFELPAVADRARQPISQSSIANRCRVEGGDFFSAVPGGADAYVLRHIIHDWLDPEASTILKRCREAMQADGRVLVIESVIPRGNEPGFGKWLDLMMLLVGGKERTEDEYRVLFESAGLRLVRIIPTASDVSIVEAQRA